MADRTKSGIDLAGLARALTDDVRAMACPTGSGRPRKTDPFANLTSALRAVEARFEEVRREATARQAEHREARLRILSDSVALRARHLEHRVDLRKADVTAAAPDRLVVAGRLVDGSTGEGLPGVRVQLMRPELLMKGTSGEVLTDDLGFYRLELSPGALADGAEPESQVRVFDESGKVFHTSDRVQKVKPGVPVVADAAVDGARLPTARARSEAGRAEVTAELEGLSRRTQEMESLDRIRTGGWVVAAPKPGRPGPVCPPVGDVAGAGPIFVTRLEAHGIVDAAGIVALEPAALARILETTEARAGKILESAKALIRERGWRPGRG